MGDKRPSVLENSWIPRISDRRYIFIWASLSCFHFFWVGYWEIRQGILFPLGNFYHFGCWEFVEAFNSGEQLDSEKSYRKYFLRMHCPGSQPASLSFHHPIAPGDFFEMYILVPLPIAYCPLPRPRTSMAGVCPVRSLSSTPLWNQHRQKQAKQIKSQPTINGDHPFRCFL